MATNPLEFLTKEDVNLLVEKADHIRFRPNELILEEGSRRQAIFILRSGAVRIERTYSGKGVPYVRLGPGEIFGEMSFVEHEGASASVYAETDAVVDVIEGHHVLALMASVPGFGTRFYQSLALTLAHRLRSTSMLIPPLMMEEIPQAKRTHDLAAQQLHHDQLPPVLTSHLQEFRREMLKADRSLKNREITQEQAQEEINRACGNIRDALIRHVRQLPGLAKTIGAHVFRETFPFFMLSKRFDRLYTKPKGYATDYLTIELLCSGEPDGAGRLGRFIDRWLMDLPFCRAFRNRRMVVAAEVKKLAVQWKGSASISVASLAAGNARELLTVCKDRDLSFIRAVCVDSDPEALSSAAGIAKELRISDRLTLLQENLMSLILGRGAIALEPQHMVYSIGLLDYVEDDYAVRLLNWISDHLVPGGTLVLGNFETSNSDRPLMDYILDWQLIHRSESQIRDLFSRSNLADGKLEVKFDDTGTQLLAVCAKAP